MSNHQQYDNPGDTTKVRPFNVTGTIFLISVLGLFLELMLIRWIGTEVRIFAYLQNTVLVVCFLGLGYGCFTSRQPILTRHILVPLLILVLLLALPFSKSLLYKISEFLSVFDDLVIWFKAVSVSPKHTIYAVFKGLSLTFLLMVLILIMFIPIGRLLGRLMNEHPRIIVAYSVNICGSLIGTWLFVLLGVLYQLPLTWFAVLAVLLFPFINRSAKGWKLDIVLLLATVCLAGLAGFQSGATETIWSPYQKLVLKDGTATESISEESSKSVINVNNVGYQALLDLSQENISAHPQIFPPEYSGYSQYDLPARFHPNAKTMLIVGAGAGNDAAGAIRQGLQKITAVEIDPAILSLGRTHHPEKPYDSPRVTAVVDDARSFFATCREKYDVIAFGLLDSHTSTAMTNVRLDHFVYTRQSFEQAKALLAEGGIMVLTFEAQKQYIADRMGKALFNVFGEKPLTFRIIPSNYGWGGVMFVNGDLETAKRQIEQDRILSEIVRGWPIELNFDTPSATDDWPYIYLKTKNIPILYYLLAGLLLLLLVVCRMFFSSGAWVVQWRKPHWHFFFLGAAFLLLEVQNVSKCALVLGNTWLVNAVIISGVLLMILAANVIAAKFPKLPLIPVYVLLFASCLTLYFVNIAQFAVLSFANKAVIVGIFTTLPMLFSGIIFIRSFAAFSEKDEALGANLVGALVGATLQSITFIIGFQALLLIVAALYFLAFLLKPSIAVSDGVA